MNEKYKINIIRHGDKYNIELVVNDIVCVGTKESKDLTLTTIRAESLMDAIINAGLGFSFDIGIGLREVANSERKETTSTPLAE